MENMEMQRGCLYRHDSLHQREPRHWWTVIQDSEAGTIYRRIEEEDGIYRYMMKKMSSMVHHPGICRKEISKLFQFPNIKLPSPSISITLRVQVDKKNHHPYDHHYSNYNNKRSSSSSKDCRGRLTSHDLRTIIIGWLFDEE